MKDRDYEFLTGKRITYECVDGTTESVVGGCSFDIGISMQSPKGVYTLCINGPKSPLVRCEGWEWNSVDKKYYPALFYSTVRMTKKGIVKAKVIAKILELMYGDSREEPSIEVCPYNQ